MPCREQMHQTSAKFICKFWYTGFGKSKSVRLDYSTPSRFKSWESRSETTARRDTFCVQPPGQRGMPPCCALVLIQRRKHSCKVRATQPEIFTTGVGPFSMPFQRSKFMVTTSTIVASQPLLQPAHFCWRHFSSTIFGANLPALQKERPQHTNLEKSEIISSTTNEKLYQIPWEITMVQ